MSIRLEKSPEKFVHGQPFGLLFVRRGCFRFSPQGACLGKFPRDYKVKFGGERIKLFFKNLKKVEESILGQERTS